MKVSYVSIKHCVYGAKRINRFIFINIYMFAIAGQTAEQNWLTYLVKIKSYPRGEKATTKLKFHGQH